MNNIYYYGEPWMDADRAGYTTPGWYFWAETLSDCFGPYDTYEDAEAGLKSYCKIVLGKGEEIGEDLLD